MSKKISRFFFIFLFLLSVSFTSVNGAHQRGGIRDWEGLKGVLREKSLIVSFGAEDFFPDTCNRYLLFYPPIFQGRWAIDVPKSQEGNLVFLSVPKGVGANYTNRKERKKVVEGLDAIVKEAKGVSAVVSFLHVSRSNDVRGEAKRDSVMRLLVFLGGSDEFVGERLFCAINSKKLRDISLHSMYEALARAFNPEGDLYPYFVSFGKALKNSEHEGEVKSGHILLPNEQKENLRKLREYVTSTKEEKIPAKRLRWGALLQRDASNFTMRDKGTDACWKVSQKYLSLMPTKDRPDDFTLYKISREVTRNFGINPLIKSGADLGPWPLSYQFPFVGVIISVAAWVPVLGLGMVVTWFVFQYLFGKRSSSISPINQPDGLKPKNTPKAGQGDGEKGAVRSHSGGDPETPQEPGQGNDEEVTSGSGSDQQTTEEHKQGDTDKVTSSPGSDQRPAEESEQGDTDKEISTPKSEEEEPGDFWFFFFHWGWIFVDGY